MLNVMLVNGILYKKGSLIYLFACLIIYDLKYILMKLELSKAVCKWLKQLGILKDPVQCTVNMLFVE
jgi:hypothetical protein